jgi:hypothetical protein
VRAASAWQPPKTDAMAMTCPAVADELIDSIVLRGQTSQEW